LFSIVAFKTMTFHT